MKIYDLTLPITPSLIVWPGDPPVRITREADVNAGDEFSLSRLEMSAHTGTHVDAPAHFISGGGGVETLPLDVLIGPALVVELLERKLNSTKILWPLRPVERSGWWTTASGSSAWITCL
ncbi:MAG: hypothetical protein HF973_15280 [Chloroflexi bacterium]|nr:hypothetical protein [Chloroflexota bacterium]